MAQFAPRSHSKEEPAMKKLTALLLLLGLMLSLCACGGEAPAPTAEPETTVEPTAEPTPEELMAASESDAAAYAMMTPPASGSDITVDADLYAKAQEFIGLSAKEMYEAIGEPTSVQYAASCLEEDADDGMLYYPGFYVWTVRQGANETVHAVYLEE